MDEGYLDEAIERHARVDRRDAANTRRKRVWRAAHLAIGYFVAFGSGGGFSEYDFRDQMSSSAGSP